MRWVKIQEIFAAMSDSKTGVRGPGGSASQLRRLGERLCVYGTGHKYYSDGFKVHNLAPSKDISEDVSTRSLSNIGKCRPGYPKCQAPAPSLRRAARE